MTAAEQVKNANIRHAVYLQRYSASTVRKILALLEKSDARVVARLQKETLTEIGRARLDRLLESMRTITAQAHETLRDDMRSEIRELAKYEAGFQTQLVKSAIPVDVDFVTPAAPQLYAAVNARPFNGRLLSEWFRDLEANSFRRLKDAITMGVVEGRTTDQIVREIRGTARQGYRDGILAISKRGAEATVRTAINHTVNVAREQTYAENADIVKGVQWVSTLDGRTTAVCRGRDGEVYPLDKGPRPPAHINCRSTTVPVLKSWKELGIPLKEAPPGTRASMNGQVPATETYDSWLRKQDSGFQDEVLGKAKAQLFRDGGLTLDRFVDASGHEFTLDQLRQRESETWAKVFGAMKEANE